MISALGDSLTWGYPFGPEASWAQDRGPVKILNFGVNGDTLADMLTRLETALAPGPDILLVMGGANDVFCDRSLARMETDLLALAEKTEEAGISFWLGFTPPVLDGSERQLSAWRQRQRELAAKRGWGTVDFFASVTDRKGLPYRELFWDECHLTKEGYARMADYFQKRIRDLGV